MKKSLLFAVALFTSVAMPAQTIWTCEGTSDQDLSGLKATTSETNVTVADAVCGTGLEVKGIQQKYKTSDGTSFYYCSDETKSLYKFTPTNVQITVGEKTTTDNKYRELESAAAEDMLVKFNIAIEEGNTTDYLSISGIKFDAARCGTDAVRINARLIGEGDEGEYNSGWLITADNWSTVSGGIGAWKDASEDGIDGGCMPAREDGSKADSSPDKGCTTYNIPVPTDMPALFDATLEIAIYGISSNKSAVLHNVTILHGNGGSGISNITTDTENINAPVYNLAGQRVSKDAKGILIQNGKKFINK